MEQAITTKELHDEDYLTQSARGYGNIPANTVVEFLGFTQNLYGSYAKALYNGNLYYVDPEGLHFIE